MNRIIKLNIFLGLFGVLFNFYMGSQYQYFIDRLPYGIFGTLCLYYLCEALDYYACGE